MQQYIAPPLNPLTQAASCSQGIWWVGNDALYKVLPAIRESIKKQLNNGEISVTDAAIHLPM